MNASVSLIDPSWYLVQTKPRQEFRALEHLEIQHYQCFLPTLEVEKVRRGKVSKVIEPLFSRYLFIQLDRVTSNWGQVRYTRGVSKLVAFGNNFATVAEHIIDAFRHPTEHRYVPMFSPGDRVVIDSGPFFGIEGIYQIADGEARALVLIELINQPQMLKFGKEMLRKVM